MRVYDSYSAIYRETGNMDGSVDACCRNVWLSISLNHLPGVEINPDETRRGDLEIMLYIFVIKIVLKDSTCPQTSPSVAHHEFRFIKFVNPKHKILKPFVKQNGDFVKILSASHVLSKSA